MAGNAGPNGSGLLPPGVGEPSDEETEERDENEGASGGGEELDLEGVPPVERDEDDEEEDGEDEEDDDESRRDSLEEIERRLEEKFQKKFDRAVSKAVRNLERKNGARKSPRVEEEEEDTDDNRSVRPARHSAGGSGSRSDSPNVTSIRLLARDVISDEMEESGKQERMAVKKVVDQIVPLVNWELVDDESEFVETLVDNLKGVASDLVKTGSDRKVAQLKKAGVLQQRPGQPGSAPQSGNRGQVAKKLEQGAAAAGRRFPQGSRSLHSR